MPHAQAAFLNALLQGCEHCNLRNVRVLVAVSGGADSVALLRGLALLNDDLHCDLHVAHLNHHLRGDESDADAAWVEGLCELMGIPCEVGNELIRERPELTKLGLEGTARLVRRRFLQQAAHDTGCVGIAVAHTANDQAETILHHILRGTGLAGLRGMKSPVIASDKRVADTAEIPMIRPMLNIERELLERFLAELHQDWRTDSTNTDTTLTRNRIRHELLPLLAREFNPHIQDALLRLGEQAKEIYGREIELADALLQAALIESTPTHCRLQCSKLAEHSPHRIREAFVQLWRRLDWPRRPMGFNDWERLVRLLETGTTAITLPGNINASRRGDLLMLTKHESNRESANV